MSIADQLDRIADDRCRLMEENRALRAYAVTAVGYLRTAIAEADGWLDEARGIEPKDLTDDPLAQARAFLNNAEWAGTVPEAESPETGRNPTADEIRGWATGLETIGLNEHNQKAIPSLIRLLRGAASALEETGRNVHEHDLLAAVHAVLRQDDSTAEGSLQKALGHLQAVLFDYEQTEISRKIDATLRHQSGTKSGGTPRTDKHVKDIGADGLADGQFARSLECEADAYRDAAERLLEERDRLADRVAELSEGNDRLLRHIGGECHQVNRDDARDAERWRRLKALISGTNVLVQYHADEGRDLILDEDPEHFEQVVDSWPEHELEFVACTKQEGER